MRRLTVLLLALVFVLPATAPAGRAAPGDGSLVVTNGDGLITVQVKGVIFGQFDRGKLTVLEYRSDNPTALPTVSGAKWDVKGSKPNVVYTGTDVRFLFPSGSYTLKFEGSGVDLSAVGKGTLKVNGTGKNPYDDGTASVNGAKPVPLPSIAVFGGSTLAVTGSVDKSIDKSSGAATSSSNGR